MTHPIGSLLRYRSHLLSVMFFAIMLTIAVFSSGLGPVSIDALTVSKVATHHIIGIPSEPSWPLYIDSIVWLARLPRIFMAMAAGAILAVSGAVLQAIIRNPLAEPYVLGVNAGASTGAALVITGLSFAAGSIVHLSIAAFLGALFAMVLVLLITGFRDVTSFRLIMSGLAVGYGLSSITSFLIFASDSPEMSRSVMFWLMGSMAAIKWQTAILTTVISIIFLLMIMVFSGYLDAMAAGDETSLAVGISPSQTRISLMVIISMGVGVVIAGAGSIGFVGLIIPHFARSVLGSSHRFMLPSCAFMGGAFLLIADMGARLLFAPQEMAIGVVTGVIGFPFLVYILYSSNSCSK